MDELNNSPAAACPCLGAAGVIILDWPSTGGNNVPTTGHSCVEDLEISFAQPPDTVTTASAATAPGNTTVTLASVTNVAVGDGIVDFTNNSIPNPQGTGASLAAPTTITAIAGNVVTLSTAVVSPGVGLGDQIKIWPARGRFKTLAAGCTSGAGGTGCQYPPAIYSVSPGDNSFDGRFTLRDLRVSAAWHVDHVLDVFHGSRFHFWNFGIAGALFLTYYDGQTYAAQIGRSDGMVLTDLFTVVGGVKLLSNFGYGEINSLTSDQFAVPGSVPLFEIDHGTIQLTAPQLPSNGQNCVLLATGSGTEVVVSNGTIANYGSTSGSSAVCLQSGAYGVFTGNTIAASNSGNVKAILQSGGGTIGIYTGNWIAVVAGDLSVVPVTINGGGQVSFKNNTFTAGAPDYGNAGVYVAADNFNNDVSGNNMGTYYVSGAGSSLSGGRYWPNTGIWYQTVISETSCGTGHSGNGNLYEGTVTTGTGATKCNITLGNGFLHTARCVVSAENGTPEPYSLSLGFQTSVLTINPAVAGAVYDYDCKGF